MNQPCQICADSTATYFSDEGQFCNGCVPKKRTEPLELGTLLPGKMKRGEWEKMRSKMRKLEKRIEFLERTIEEWSANS